MGVRALFENSEIVQHIWAPAIVAEVCADTGIPVNACSYLQVFAIYMRKVDIAADNR